MFKQQNFSEQNQLTGDGVKPDESSPVRRRSEIKAALFEEESKDSYGSASKTARESKLQAPNISLTP